LKKDREALLAFYDFTAEHWQHLRTTNPVESTFATVKLRTYRTKGAGRESLDARFVGSGVQGVVTVNEEEEFRPGWARDMLAAHRGRDSTKTYRGRSSREQNGHGFLIGVRHTQTRAGPHYSFDLCSFPFSRICGTIDTPFTSVGPVALQLFADTAARPSRMSQKCSTVVATLSQSVEVLPSDICIIETCSPLLIRTCSLPFP
jgi:hypothetical protein